ncbi:DUF5808 domain-containing protein [Flavobacterium eburneipallidum]|uniref:DUF5808 domain-containing protein n=1 Tax=Flavobacterium eburneipallidum TaxID=3003263 RepID=UPI0022AC6932|nr:DUF5808 domain-containing protein [Flavobacterium eburneipallidum]
MEDPDNPSPETQERWFKDPNNWIWGIFYYNPKDNRIFPPKRNSNYGAGFTTNFANPKSVLTLIGILLFFAFVAILIQKTK